MVCTVKKLPLLMYNVNSQSWQFLLIGSYCFEIDCPHISEQTGCVQLI